jgi:predicted NUDIX family NTP pyrophosphohydrolase
MPLTVKLYHYLLYRIRAELEVLLIHMGGPIWAKKDFGAWSIPKGVIGPEEDQLHAAKREFQEETGFAVEGEFEALGTFQQNSSKQLTIWALQGDCDPQKLRSNSFTMEWPPKSGKLMQFPEADRAAWLSREPAVARIVKGQRVVLEHFFARDAVRGS